MFAAPSEKSAVAARIPTPSLGKPPAVIPARTTSTPRFRLCGEQRMALPPAVRSRGFCPLRSGFPCFERDRHPRVSWSHRRFAGGPWAATRRPVGSDRDSRVFRGPLPFPTSSALISPPRLFTSAISRPVCTAPGAFACPSFPSGVNPRVISPFRFTTPSSLPGVAPASRSYRRPTSASSWALRRHVRIRSRIRLRSSSPISVARRRSSNSFPRTMRCSTSARTQARSLARPAYVFAAAGSVASMRLWESYIDANGAYGFGVEEVGNTQYAVAPMVAPDYARSSACALGPMESRAQALRKPVIPAKACPRGSGGGNPLNRQSLDSRYPLSRAQAIFRTTAAWKPPPRGRGCAPPSAPRTAPRSTPSRRRRPVCSSAAPEGGQGGNGPRMHPERPCGERARSSATFDELDDGAFAGTVPACQGVAAFGDALMGCRRRLQSTREDG